MKIEEYVKKHNHICYCELIICPNGDVVEANPSHTETLIALCELKREEIDNEMPIYASPLHWLVEFNQMCAVYYDCAILPVNVSLDQLNSIILIKKNGVLSDDYSVVLSNEYSKCCAMKKAFKQDFEELNKKKVSKKREVLNHLIGKGIRVV